MDVSTPQGARAAPGLVYTTKGCAAPGGVFTTGAWAVSGHVYTSVACVGTGQHISQCIYFEIWTHECALKKVYAWRVCAKKRPMHAECALKMVYTCWVCAKKTVNNYKKFMHVEHPPKNVYASWACAKKLSTHAEHALKNILAHAQCAPKSKFYNIFSNTKITKSIIFQNYFWGFQMRSNVTIII